MRSLGKSDPEKIGPFSVVAKLGSGGMGSVYLGSRGFEKVAIKVIKGSLMDDPVARERFRREIEALSLIKSPFVAPVIDADAEAENPWLALEFIGGPSLKERIEQDGPLSEDDWFILAVGLLQALEAVHAAGVTHRDIKPSNVLLASFGPYLIDFGIAQSVDQTSITTVGSVVGSPAWLAPEQLEGAPVTAAADLFSLGSVLVYAATGHSPWGDETSQSVPQIFKKILDGSPDLSSLSGTQKALVEGLLHPQPGARILPGDALVQLGQRTARAPAQTKKLDEGAGKPGFPSQPLIILGSALAIVLLVFLGMAVDELFTRGEGSAPEASVNEEAQAPQACIQSYWVNRDLGGVGYDEILSAIIRGSLITRECREFDGDNAVSFQTEVCAYRNASASEGPDINILRVKPGEELSSRSLTWNERTGDRHGCRSYAELGIMSWDETIGAALSYSMTNTVSADDVKSGVMFVAQDGSEGSFVTSVIQVDGGLPAVDLTVPVFGRAWVELTWESGSYWGYASKGAAVENEFPVEGTTVMRDVCWGQAYPAELKAEGKAPLFQVKTDEDEWVDIESLWLEYREQLLCRDGYPVSQFTTSAHSFFPWLRRNECVTIRFVSQATKGYYGSKEPLLCAKLFLSSLGPKQAEVSGQELALLEDFLDREMTAWDQDFDSWLSFIKETNYPGLYDTDSASWASGESERREDWNFYQAPVVLNLPPSQIVPDVEWVHRDRQCSVPQIGPPQGRTFYAPTNEWRLGFVRHLTILDGKVYQYHALCDW